MSEIITTFNLVGECDVDVKEVVSKWNDSSCIAQTKDEYTLSFADPFVKCKISKDQARDIIFELNLYAYQSSFFRYGKTWLTEKQIATIVKNDKRNE